VTCRDGTEKIVDFIPVQLETGENLMACEDITERKQVEEALLIERERLETVTQNIGAGLAIISKDYGTLWANKVLKDLFGDVEGKICHLTYNQRNEVCPECGVREIFEKGSEKVVHEQVGKDIDGNKIWSEIIATPIKDEKGNITAALELVIPITERKGAEEALRESEERYRLLAENAMDVIWTADMSLNVTYISPSVYRVRGYMPEEVMATKLTEQLTPDSFALANWVLSEELAIEAREDRDLKRSRKLELEFTRKDGSTYWSEVNLTFIRDSQGKPVGILGVSRDITERKRAEDALRESEEYFRRLTKQSPIPIAIIGDKGEVDFLNERFNATFGYTLDDLPNLKAWWPRAYPDEQYRKEVIASWQNAVKEAEATTGDIKPSEYRVTCKNGTIRIAEIFGSKIGNKILVLLPDITERKRAEEIILNEKQKFQTLSENAPFGMVMIDKVGTFKYVNPKFRELFGYDLNDLSNGKEWFKKAFPDPLYRDEIISAWVRDLETSKPGEKRPRTFTVTCKDETEKIINFIPVELETGENLMTCEDITERMRAEEEMAALQEQLRQSQKMESIGRLAGGIAHDFNNLLTIIKGYSQLSLLELKEGDSLKGNIEEVKRASERAVELTHQLLAFSRRQVMEMKVLGLNIILENLDKMLRRLIGEDIELTTLLAEDLGNVKTDPGQMEQVIMNLVVNARDAMLDGGKLTIETANVELDEAYAHTHVAVKPGRYVMISVSDTGVGMSPEVKDRVFEPFFTTKEKGKGTGLGLSTVYGIVKQSGGNIWVYSVPGKGTTFKIYLPRVDEPLEKLGRRVEVNEIPRGTETILLVEDEEEVRNLAVRFLESQGYKVLKASQGLEAFLIAEEYEGIIHLLMTDVVMPKLSGRELADRIAEIRPEIKVLFMSGYADNAIVHHGVLEGGMNYLQKPFTLDGLAKKVREVLDKASEAQNGFLE
jgi:PAS domain S-box-containing protein